MNFQVIMSDLPVFDEKGFFFLLLTVVLFLFTFFITFNRF